MKNTINVLVYMLGIYVCYSGYGIVQERLTTVPFGDEGKKFDFMTTMLFVQSIFNIIVALAGLWLQNLPIVEWHHQPKKYAAISLTYMGAMLASNQALIYIDYPSQVLAKGSKPVFVLFISLLAGRRFPAHKFFTVAAITLGAVLFLSNKVHGKVADSLDPEMLFYGRSLVLFSLILDGITAMLQDFLAKHGEEHTESSEAARPSSYHLMLYINIWACLYIFVGMVVTGQIVTSTAFCVEFPLAALLLVAFSLCSGLGQVFIFLTIRHYGALLCSMVTTTRKFSTILISVLLYGHSLSPLQWFCCLLVFGSLLFDSMQYDRKKSMKRNKSNEI